MHEWLSEVHEMWDAQSCTQTCYYMHEKTCTKVSNFWSPDCSWKCEHESMLVSSSDE